MDEFIGKPVKAKRLEKMLCTLFVGGVQKKQRSLKVSAEKPYSDLESIFEDDPGRLLEIVDLFLKETPKRMKAIERSIAKRDTENLFFATHSFKSSASHFSAYDLVNQLQRIENLAKNQNQCDFSIAEESYHKLEETTKQVVTNVGMLQKKLARNHVPQV